LKASGTTVAPWKQGMTKSNSSFGHLCRMMRMKRMNIAALERGADGFLRYYALRRRRGRPMRTAADSPALPILETLGPLRHWLEVAERYADDRQVR
jgi:hypothetical protein